MFCFGGGKLYIYISVLQTKRNMHCPTIRFTDIVRVVQEEPTLFTAKMQIEGMDTRADKQCQCRQLLATEI
jgi:hypothetical protein